MRISITSKNDFIGLNSIGVDRSDNRKNPLDFNFRFDKNYSEA